MVEGQRSQEIRPRPVNKGVLLALLMSRTMFLSWAWVEGE